MKPILLLAASLLLSAAPALAETGEEARASRGSGGGDVEGCVECHGDPDLEVTLESGETKKLHVDKDVFLGSRHGGKLSCTDCHVDLKGSEGGHPEKPFKTSREFVVRYSEQCRSCHSDHYAQTLDSVHHAVLEKGNLKAAVCADCHGAHDVGRPGEPRASISKTCAKCHSDIFATYSASVHGTALLDRDNPDVPTCTDCHQSHAIASPRTGAWRLQTPDRCGACHGDEQKMKKYGLSNAVLKTYLSDFHGTTASLQKAEPGANPVVALCTDCHGIHDISKVKDPGSRVLQANLVKTCQKCHPEASANFPAAWMSHYEPSPDKSPLVYAVKLFYMFMVPFVIGGLILQIGLHLWRVVVKR